VTAPRWRRADGTERFLPHLDGPPAEIPPLVATRADRILDWLDARVPFWDDALMLAVLLAILVPLVLAARP
jgi:hypothetical protein